MKIIHIALRENDYPEGKLISDLLHHHIVDKTSSSIVIIETAPTKQESDTHDTCHGKNIPSILFDSLLDFSGQRQESEKTFRREWRDISKMT